MSTYVLRRAAARSRTTGEGRDTWHCFSFGAHYDPANVGFGDLVACNDERLEPGAGYGTHLHRDVDLVTWVVEGALTHADSAGRGGVLGPGSVQLLSAGGGIEHSERNEGPVPVRFVQMWLRSASVDGHPEYELRDVRSVLGAGSMARVLSVGKSVLWAGRLAPGAEGELPPGPLVHVFVVRGAGRIDAGDAAVEVEEGDSLGVTDCAGAAVSAGSEGLELLGWVLPAERAGHVGGR